MTTNEKVNIVTDPEDRRPDSWYGTTYEVRTPYENAVGHYTLLHDDTQPRTLIIANLWVAMRHRRKGISRFVFEAAEEQARQQGCTRLRLTTYRGWRAAYYQSLGFNPLPPSTPVSYNQPYEIWMEKLL